jgi:hypothetical protein
MIAIWRQWVMLQESLSKQDDYNSYIIMYEFNKMLSLRYNVFI